MVRAASSARTPAGDRSSSARVAPKATRARRSSCGSGGVEERRTSSRSVRPLTRAVTSYSRMRAVATASMKGSTRRGSTNRAVAVRIVKRRSRNVTRPSRVSSTPSTAGAAVEPSTERVPPIRREAVRFRTTRLSSSLTAIAQRERDPAGRRPGRRPVRSAGGGSELARVDPPDQAQLPLEQPARGAARQLQIAVPEGREAVERRRGDAPSREDRAIGPEPPVRQRRLAARGQGPSAEDAPSLDQTQAGGRRGEPRLDFAYGLRVAADRDARAVEGSGAADLGRRGRASRGHARVQHPAGRFHLRPERREHAQRDPAPELGIEGASRVKRPAARDRPRTPLEQQALDTQRARVEARDDRLLARESLARDHESERVETERPSPRPRAVQRDVGQEPRRHRAVDRRSLPQAEPSPQLPEGQVVDRGADPHRGARLGTPLGSRAEPTLGKAELGADRAPPELGRQGPGAERLTRGADPVEPERQRGGDVLERPEHGLEAPRRRAGKAEGRGDHAELRQLGRSEPGLQATASAPLPRPRSPHGHAANAGGHGGRLEPLGVHPEGGVERLDRPAAHRQDRGRQRSPSAPPSGRPRRFALEREWILPEDGAGVGNPDGGGREPERHRDPRERDLRAREGGRLEPPAGDRLPPRPAHVGGDDRLAGNAILAEATRQLGPVGHEPAAERDRPFERHAAVQGHAFPPASGRGSTRPPARSW